VHAPDMQKFVPWFVSILSNLHSSRSPSRACFFCTAIPVCKCRLPNHEHTYEKKMPNTAQN
jgi:hypothetical protein